jgi:hypothetical protein
MNRIDQKNAGSLRPSYRWWSSALSLLLAVAAWLLLALAVSFALGDPRPGEHYWESINKNIWGLRFSLLFSVASFVISLVLGVRVFKSKRTADKVISTPGLAVDLCYMCMWVYFLAVNLKGK